MADNTALSYMQLSDSHQIGGAAYLESFLDGRIVSVRLLDSTYWSIDIWGEACKAVIEAWDPATPALLLCDVSIYRLGLTSHLYACLEDIETTALEHHLAGRLAVALARSSLVIPIRSLLTQHGQEFRHLERGFFMSRDSAFAWLQEQV